ncbi:class I SAM-dependent methyltransferase [Candidatus Aenigmatarchaeota archaeon]
MEKSWEDTYATIKNEEMPWYNKNLDEDLKNELKSRNISSGSFLDLGTGPGTQAVELSKLGFDVVGVDISKTAIDRAKKLSTNVEFIEDDILDTKLDKKFDYIFDRGTFHVFSQDQWERYKETIEKLLNQNGILFLKCFSIQEEGNEGPHRFSEDELRKVFSDIFNIEKITDTIYQGKTDRKPKSLFAVMVKK